MVRKLVLSLIAVLGFCALALAQNRQVTGTVTGADGSPIVGATVLVEGTATGTTTDANGNFAVMAPANGTLSVSFIGYAPQQVAIAGKTAIDIKMAEDTKAIEDVIVVAFGTAKKEAFTGSASVMKSEDINKVQTSNVAQALAGKVAGVQLSNSSGQPGSAPTIRIRGISSINADSKPLIVLDGMPYEGDMGNINPNDIESMTVLKDAASNALYGARGANGVIMLTTKKGRSGDAVITVDAKWGVNAKALKSYDYITDPGQYYENHFKSLYNMEFSNTGDPAGAYKWASQNLITGSYGLGYQVYNVPDGQTLIGTNGKLNPNATLGRKVTYNGQDYLLMPDDWTDEAFRTSLRQEYNVSIAGSTDRSSFYGSFGYLNDEGIVLNSNMKRLTGRLKADYQAKKWLKVGGTAAYANFESNSLNDEGLSGSSGNLFTFTSMVGPIYPVYIRDGEGNILRDARGFKRYDYGDGKNAGLNRPVMSSGNPLSSTQLDTQKYYGNALNANGFVDITFLKDFKLTINGGVSLDATRSNSITNPYYGQYATSNGIVAVQNITSFSYNFQQLLNYHKTIGGEHTIDAMIGHEYYNYNYYYQYGDKSNMLTTDNDELAGAVVNGTPSSYRTEYNTEGYFGRLQYDFKEKLFLSGSYRRDASSRFAPNHRWGNFWSVGAAWILNRESWFNAKWVDLLKLKASYGSQGNDNIGDYRYTNTFYIKSAGGEVSVPPYYPGKETITWETNGNLNAGVEFGLFGNRLNGSVDYFYRKTTDMLFERPVPLSMGYSSYFDNIGDMVNKGVEIELNAVLINKKNFTWDFSFNATFLKNKITKLPPEKGEGFAQPKEAYWIGVGDSYYTWYMSKFAGVDENGQSMWYMDVKDGAGNVTRETTTDYSLSTKYKCGDPFPTVYGGFGTSLNFYGFDVGVNFTYSIGGKAYDSGYAALMGSPNSGATGDNVHRDILNAWTPENHSTTIPRYQMGDQYSASQSDRFLTDASYLNIQNINVGYTLPRKWTSKISIDRIRIYLACDNVWYWSKRQGFDPRQSFKGDTSGEKYSPVRTISGGVTIQF